MAKEFTFRGMTVPDLMNLSFEDFIKMVPSRERRTLVRLNPKIKETMIAIENSNEKKPIRTHLRDIVITPRMIGKLVLVYNGKEFVRVDIKPEMIAHRLGEYSITRRRVQHSDPGIGATRSSKFISLR